MIPLLDHCDALGRAASAVNAARRNDDGSIEGALFDGVGFTKALDHWAIPIEGRRILVVDISRKVAADLSGVRALFGA